MEKINNKESIGLIITFILNNIGLVCSQIVVVSCESASLLNSIYISIIAILLTVIICLLYKKFAGQDILDISNFLGGKFLKIIVGIIFLAYFIFTISILLNKITDCLQISYYPLTNVVYIIFLFIIAAGIACSFKNNSLPKANYIFLPVVLASIILVFMGNIKNFNFDAIYPLLGYDVNSTFFSGLGNLFAFSGIAYLYFLPPKLKSPEKFNKIALTAIILSAIFFIISIASILFMFNNTLSNSELLPLYTAVRYIAFGSFFQRLDSAFLLIWVISFIGLVSMITNLCTNIIKKITNISDNKPLIAPVLLVIFGINMLIKNDAYLAFAENILFKILFFTITIGLAFSILLLANLKHKKSMKGCKND